MSDLFTPEQEAEIKRRMDAMRADIDAKYAAKAHQFRDWIVAHPLPAARVIGAVCLVVGCALGYKLGPMVAGITVKLIA